MYALAQPREQFVANGTGLFGDEFRPQRVAVVSSIYEDFRPCADAGEISQVNLHLVHADAPKDRSGIAFNQNMAFAG